MCSIILYNIFKLGEPRVINLILIRPKYNSHIITPPIGLGYLSSYLNKQKYLINKPHLKIKIIDALKDNLSNEEVLKLLKKERPAAIGITCMTSFYHEVINLSNMIKEYDKHIPIIIGGPHPTFLSYQTLVDSKADFVICGEGEIPLSKLVESDFTNTPGIKGVYSLKNLKNKDQEIIKSDRIENLDDLPFPDWYQINPNYYPMAPHGAIVRNFPIGVITSTRGCPYNCKFCASPKFYDRKIRYRSPSNVVDEIEYLYHFFGIKEIHFEDDNLTLKRDHIVEICNLLLKRNIKISWACPNGIRADKVDEELIKLMKKSGCYYFAYGVESANKEILESINKKESIEKIEDSIRLANKYGISCQGFFIFGLPGETKDTIKESLDFAKRSELSRAQFIIFDVLPGCYFWDELKDKFKPNWKKNSYKEPEWIPKGLDREFLLESQSKAFKEFYFRFKIFFRLFKSIRVSQIKYILKRFKDYRLV